MNPEIRKQINDYFTKSQTIALVLPEQITIDQYAAALALHDALQKQGKRAVIMTSAPQLPELAFLAPLPQVLPQIQPGGSLVVRVATSSAQLDELSYQTDAEAVTIFLKPKGGEFSPADVSVQSQPSSYDLFILLGVQTMEQLGSLYQQNAETFFNTPRINIDISPANEYGGTINAVEVTASSLSEVVAGLLGDADHTERITTLLLTGIIAATHSFRDSRTTPETLTVAAELMSHGARQTEIIQHLYKTKAFATLKLWGRALARLTTVPDASLLYSVITKADLEKTGQSLTDLPVVLHDIIDNISGYNIVALLAESNSGIQVLLAGLPHVKVTELAKQLTSAPVQPLALQGLHEYVTLTVSNSAVTEVEQKLLEIVRK